MISLISAIAKNNCIGKNGTLPWHLPEDLKHFKEVTDGKIVLMGKKTWDSLPEKFRPLPNRKNIVVTFEEDAFPPEVAVFFSLDEALAAYKTQDIIIIGGASIYEQTLPLADTLYITHINEIVDGDKFFPVIDPTIWEETTREDHGFFAFVTYKKRQI